MKPVTIIVAIAEDRAIGNKQELLCHLPNDLKRFKELTTGHTVVMGRKTFDSLPKGALPNRINRVLTTQVEWSAPNVEVVHRVEEILTPKDSNEELFVMGGASLYRAALPVADRLAITWIHHRFEEADTFFPEIDFSQWKEVRREAHPADEKHPYPYTFVDYERKR